MGVCSGSLDCSYALILTYNSPKIMFFQLTCQNFKLLGSTVWLAREMHFYTHGLFPARHLIGETWIKPPLRLDIHIHMSKFQTSRFNGVAGERNAFLHTRAISRTTLDRRKYHKTTATSRSFHANVNLKNGEI